MSETLTPSARAQDLLAQMSAEEKLWQLTAEMLFHIDETYEQKRKPLHGSYRNPGHFMHYDRPQPQAPSAVAERINRDVQLSLDAQPHHIPPLENGEALHGAQWGMATSFPQPIGMAATFDPTLIESVGEAIGKECACVGVRQVFAPVVNVVRDCRWGRTVETFGEDVKLTSDMGAAISAGLQKSGVIATPKHFADNYAAGGRDSNYSETSERTLREVFLPPFKACIDAGALSVMAAYNAWDGVPCSCHAKLLTEILRREWGFTGFVVSDYGGVDGVSNEHRFAASPEAGAAACIRAGLDVVLPFDRYDVLKKAYDDGLLDDESLDRAVLRILTAKFTLGLFDNPYVDPAGADRLVRCDAHRALALQSARESLVLLKNDGLLPLDKTALKRLGVFGDSADVLPVGRNYSGPYNAPWTAPDVPTPLAFLRAFLPETEVVFFDENASPAEAADCDAVLYFASMIEGEGKDRSDVRLPGIRRGKATAGGGIIVDATEQESRIDQEATIRALYAHNPNLAVIICGGAPVETSAWLDHTAAVLEAWYPGEEGSRAIAEVLFGEVSPSGKLPICFPKSVGQLPLYYACKPSGRGYDYSDVDGKPQFPFGFGLSYTRFAVTDAACAVEDNRVTVSFSLANRGEYDGAEVLQLYVAGRCCDVVRPLQELKGYCRLAVPAGQSADGAITLGEDAFCYYDRELRFGLHDGDYDLLLGTSSEDVLRTFSVRVRDGKIEPAAPCAE